jgi:UDP-glucose 4-epimerase
VDAVDLSGKQIVVIGGAGLIGSHIVDQLVEQPVRAIVVVDNFVRGSRANLENAVRSGWIRSGARRDEDPDCKAAVRR